MMFALEIFYKCDRELFVLELFLPHSLLSLQIQVLLIQQLQNITS